ncbi:MAG: chloride channel protein [Candidatus Palauibacterales bacterium]|nr:chloride channel protein [Candidatus Palauibacterales bacterium]MDP2530588.1 chloride channel protein [Candidatus Palauibacterales bacterium]MDP2583613.1 chloride channel protein [Candidatus Palauibacterales bacterium]
MTGREEPPAQDEDDEPHARPQRESAPGSAYRTGWVSVLAVLVGLCAGGAAWVLYSLIGLVTNFVFYQRLGFDLPTLAHQSLGLWILIVPSLGGLVVGLMIKYGTSRVRGHGIPEAMEAVLANRSRIAPRVAILKPLSAAVAIGTGGPFGAEGPIIQTGGALGSVIGQLIDTTAAERKVLLACGAGAGMAAVFGTPIAGIILAIELLLFEFRSRSFIPLVIATTLATEVRYHLLGRGPIFQMQPAHYDVISGLPFYLLLGLLCGLVAVALTDGLYRVEDFFESLSLDEMWWPALGGLVLGVCGYLMPRVLGVGYDTITEILNGHFALGLLAALFLLKSIAFLVSLGSGTSGGLLAPTFMVGASLGGAFALTVNAVVPGAHLDPGAYALVGMAAVFASAARATFTLFVFAFEITRDFNSILPLMLVCVIADAVSIKLMKQTILTRKLARRGLTVPQEFEVDALQQVTVGEMMDREPPTVPASMKLSDLADRLADQDPELSRHEGLPVLDAAGRLVGIITHGDVLRQLEQGAGRDMDVLSAGTLDPVVAYPDELVHDAVLKMLHHDVGRLPVVERKDPGHLIGYLGRSATLEARLRRLQEEREREPGWLPLFRRREHG